MGQAEADGFVATAKRDVGVGAADDVVHVRAADGPQCRVGVGHDRRVAADGPRRAVTHLLGDEAHAVAVRRVRRADVV